ncbi:MAG: hypothetical protein SFU87_08410 [Chitinophagaceae bacterium]|nr:hypothetical protein [Chitinophagaceae bacterium]
MSKKEETGEKELLVERGRFEDGQYKIIAYSRFILPDKISYDSSFYYKENILVVSEKITNRNLKIQLTDPCNSGNQIIIANMTTSLGFKQPLFEITTPDCSDWFISEFVAIRADSIQKLFDISDSHPAKLERTNETTLSGFIKSRDELVGAFQDYPVSVSLKDFTVTLDKPIKQSIGFSAMALENFQVSGLNENGSAQSYFIKEGEKIMIDSIFRDIKRVRLIIRDTILLYCPISEIQGKIQGNTAG